LGLLKKNSWDVDKSLSEAEHWCAEECRETFAIINEQDAIDYNKQYRDISKQHGLELPRAADVDMAIFGLSLVAWPMR